MLRVAICDDDLTVIEQLEKFMDEMDRNRISYEVFSSAEDLYRYRKWEQREYDMYLLSIEMDGMTGLELAGMLRQEKSQALFVFMTEDSRYVYDVFEVVAFDFMIKPISAEKFGHLIERAEEYLRVSRPGFLFSYRKKTYRIPCDTISCIEKMGRKAFIHDNSGTVYQCNMTLKEIWQQLDPRMFAAVHGSCIVNLREIAGIENDEVTLKNQQVLYMSRSCRQKLKQQYFLYLKDLP